MAITSRIIVLGKADDVGATNRGFRVALWLVPPVSRRPYWLSVAPAKSAFVNATTEENTAIAAGELVEQVTTLTADKDLNMAEFQAVAEKAWNDANTKIQAFNPWQRYGTKWDGTTWTVVNTP